MVKYFLLIRKHCLLLSFAGHFTWMTFAIVRIMDSVYSLYCILSFRNLVNDDREFRSLIWNELFIHRVFTKKGFVHSTLFSFTIFYIVKNVLCFTNVDCENIHLKHFWTVAKTWPSQCQSRRKSLSLSL